MRIGPNPVATMTTIDYTVARAGMVELSIYDVAGRKLKSLVKETSGPKLVYRIGMGVRAADQNWKRQLNRLIQENQGEINRILLDFGVPLLDEGDRPLGAETAKKSP